ncbi:DUF3105 domain-containing protein [Streptomyces sp. NPDC002851]
MGPHSSGSNPRQARIAEMRRAEQARERRTRIIAVTAITVVLAGAVGGGAYFFVSKQNEQERQQAAAEAAKNKREKDLQKAAARPIENEKTWDAKELGRNHVEKPVDYAMTPPVGGDHHPYWMNCDGDVYEKPIPAKHAVHSLEHGAVWVTYNAKAPAGEVKKLKAKVEATPFSLMSPVQEQQGAIMLSAWGKQVTVDGADDPRVDSFFAKYVQGKQTPEPGAPCTDGIAQ